MVGADIEIDGEMTLWDVMRGVLRAKEARPQASVLPTMLVMKSHEIVAEIYQSSEEPRALIVAILQSKPHGEDARVVQGAACE